MPRTIKLPVSTGVRGGAVVVEGFDARRQTVILGVTPASSMNPWHQELTPPEDVIFNLSDEVTGGLLISRIYQFFDEQERLGLTKISKTTESVRVSTGSEDGEVQIVIKYTDLEDNSSREVRFGPGG
jgi:hypothetical protein